MDWIASAELLSALDRSSVDLDAKRCLHSIWKFSSCTACFDICPTDAINPGQPPTLDRQKCVNCLACLPACPTGAYHADDAVSALLDCLARLDAQRVELLCEQHPHPETRVSETDAAIRLRGCLAGLGTGGFLAGAALGLEQIVVRLDACPSCAWGRLRPRIHAQVDAACRLLEPHGRDDALHIYETLAGHATPQPAAEDRSRPVWEADNPPLSRRDFFRMASRQSRVTAARMMSQRGDAQAARQPGKDHRRIAAALRHLPDAAAPAAASLAGLGFGVLEVSTACTACGVCANVCPTGALQFQRNEEASFSLSFTPADCIACGLCVEACTPSAITLDDAPHASKLFEAGPMILLEGPLARCLSCSVLMAAQPGSKYCTLCDYRRKNPLGGRMPPGFKKINSLTGD